MAWPKHILEPGERVVLRSSDGNFVGWGIGFIALLAGLAMLRNVFELDLHEPRFWETVAGIVILAPLMALGLFLRPIRTIWALTDRRVLRHGPHDEGRAIPLHAIKDAQLGKSTLYLSGTLGEHAFELPPYFSASPGLYEVLGPRLRDPGLPVLGLADMLEPSERVVRQIPPAWTAWLRWPMLVSGPVAAVATFLWPDFKWGLLAPYLLAIMYGVMLSDIVAFWRVRGWHTVLTNQRLLRRRPEWPSRCDAFPLDAVTEATWESKRHMLVLTADGRSVDIPCLRRAARQILQALERDDRGEALV